MGCGKNGNKGNRIFVDCADNDKTDKIYFFSSDFSSSAFDCFLGLSSDFYILFCKICPARPIMPIFAGDIRRFGLEYSNWSTLIISIVSVSFAAITIVGSFFKDRFFCMVCPMLPLIHLFNKLSPVRFVKWADGCSGCGNCQRVCPMDIREVHLEKRTVW